MLALIVGAVMILAGIARLGFVADLLSKPTQIGYMNGLALTILVGQLPKLFGFSDGRQRTARRGPRVRPRARVRTKPSARRSRSALVSLALILVLGRWLPRIPGVLVAVVVAIAASRCSTSADHGVSLVGTLPQGLPAADGPAARSRTFRCWSPARSASRWSRSPTRSRPPRRSPPAPAKRSTGTGR